jgi:fructose-1,6-bisphosphatase I
MPSTSLFTVQQHIMTEQRRHYPQASGEFSWLLSGITLACKMIAAQVRRAGLVDILGSAEKQNVQGETQQKLDVLANQAHRRLARPRARQTRRRFRPARRLQQH